MRKDQRIRDPIHNLIKFSKNDEDDVLLWRLIETQPLQRLRRIRQLGFSDFVYPGASHSRLSHSIGALQMARRMLSVLERNKIVAIGDADYSQWRQATVCAVLLHDIGHGPYSHVFEEIASDLGAKNHHEYYTRKLIEQTAIGEALKERGLLEKVVSFFSKEPGASVYSNVVSSQLDADRLDFLVRDKYFTGVEFGSIDLEWLFDCLRTDEIQIEIESPAKQTVFVLDKKALSVVEDFVSAYQKMYSNVYFHKTTRAVQHMVRDVVVGIAQDESKLNKISDRCVLKAFLKQIADVPTDLYLQVDDSAVLEFLRHAATGEFGFETEIASRFFDRRLYKCFEPPRRPKDEAPRKKVAKLFTELKARKIRFIRDALPVKSYKQFDIASGKYLENILVWSDFDDDYKPVVDLAPSIGLLPDKSSHRFYFPRDEDAEKAREIWRAL